MFFHIVGNHLLDCTRYNPQDHNLNFHRCENSKSPTILNTCDNNLELGLIASEKAKTNRKDVLRFEVLAATKQM
jgi:hypothetical protein